MNVTVAAPGFPENSLVAYWVKLALGGHMCSFHCNRIPAGRHYIGWSRDRTSWYWCATSRSASRSSACAFTFTLLIFFAFAFRLILDWRCWSSNNHSFFNSVIFWIRCRIPAELKNKYSDRIGRFLNWFVNSLAANGIVSCTKLWAFPREARDLIFKIRSWTVRSDLKNKVFSAVFAYF